MRSVRTLVFAQVDELGPGRAVGVLCSVLLRSLPALQRLVTHHLPSDAHPLPSLRTIVCASPESRGWARLLRSAPGITELRVDGLWLDDDDDDDDDWEETTGSLDDADGSRGLRRVALCGAAFLYPPLRAHLAASMTLTALSVESSGSAAAYLFGHRHDPHDRPFPNPSFTSLRTLRLVNSANLDEVVPLTWIPRTLHQLEVGLSPNPRDTNFGGVARSIRALGDCVGDPAPLSWQRVELSYPVFPIEGSHRAVADARETLRDAAVARSIEILIRTVAADMGHDTDSEGSLFDWAH